VQNEVEKALRRLNWQGERILSAGRTDSGVHAAGQVIAFDLEWEHSDLDLRHALNAYLPIDIAARQVKRVNPRFDPRRHAESRCYQYRIFFQDHRDPLRERYAWRVWTSADLSRMNQAAQPMLGKHDFRAFGTPPKAGGTTVREIQNAGWSQASNDLMFEVVGNAFLYHMVRRMVSLMVEVGQGKKEVGEILSFLDPQDPEIYVQGLAPAQGLCLTAVNYPSVKLAITDN